jgi:hypothetical protein
LSTNIAAAGIRDEMELTFHLIHDTSQQQYYTTDARTHENQTACVYCAVRPVYLNKIPINLSF